MADNHFKSSLLEETLSEMDEEDWCLEDHLRKGRSAIKTISETFSGDTPRVCFHFYPQKDGYGDSWGMEADYCQLAKREFDSLQEEFDVDYIGGWSGIEAWQNVLPTEKWLYDTFPLMWEIAQKANLSLDGWSFEPSGGQTISVCGSTSVFDRGELDEPLPPQASRSFDGLKSWLEGRNERLKKP